MTERLADVVGQVEEAVLAAAAREPGAADRLASLRMLISMQLEAGALSGDEVDDDEATQLRYLATMLAFLRQHELGIRLLRDGAQRAPSRATRARLGALHGVLLAQLGQTAQARTRLEEALADDPACAEAARIHSALAVVSLDGGAAESSLLLLDNSEALDNPSAGTAFAHAFARLQVALLREDPKAAASLGNALSHAGDDVLSGLSDHHPDALAAVADLAYAQFRIARLSGQSSQLTRPASVLRAAALALTAALGAENPRTITTRIRQAECDRLSGGSGLADVRAEACRILGPDHPLTVSALAVSGPVVSSGTDRFPAAHAPNSRAFAGRSFGALPSAAAFGAQAPGEGSSEASPAPANAFPAASLAPATPLGGHASRIDTSASPSGASPRTDASRTDASRTDASRTDASRTDASRTDASRTDASRTDASSRVGASEAGRASANLAPANAFSVRPSVAGLASAALLPRARAAGAGRAGLSPSGKDLSDAGLSAVDPSSAEASRGSEARPSSADISSAHLLRDDLSRADLFGAKVSGSGLVGAGASVVGSFAVGPAVAGLSVAGHSPANPSEPGAEVAARVLGRHHPLTVVMTAAARPEGDDLAQAAAQAALVLGVGHSVTRMLDERLRSCRRTGPNTTPTHRTTDAIGTDTTAMSKPTTATTAATATASTHTAADLNVTADGGAAPPDASGAAVLEGAAASPDNAATPADAGDAATSADDAATASARPAEDGAAASAPVADAEPVAATGSDAASGAPGDGTSPGTPDDGTPASEEAAASSDPAADSTDEGGTGAATATDGDGSPAADSTDSSEPTATADADSAAATDVPADSSEPTATTDGDSAAATDGSADSSEPTAPDGGDSPVATDESAATADADSTAGTDGAGAASGGRPASGTPAPGRGRPPRQAESEEKARIWDAIEKIRDDGGVIRGKVVEVVKGGLVLDVGVRAFLPASLVEMRRVRDLNPYVGRELEAKVLEMDRGRGNLVLSRRAHLEETRSAGRSTLLEQLEPGQIRRGVISSVVNFGAFVDLGGVDGLISVAELSWTHHNHPSDVVDVGQEVEVEVLDVDQTRGRISLSLKATQQDPWPQFARNHPIGQIVFGRVTKLMPFGAFIRVDGLEGLVHVSELADHRIDTPDQVLRANQDVLVKVTDIDLQRRRISLSMRQANAEYLPEEEQFDPVTYGMLNTYDAQGNYIYPEGFDAETGEWLPGFEEQRDLWERQYADAHERWVALGAQVAAAQAGGPAYSSGPPAGPRGGGGAGGGGGGGGRRGGNDRSSSHSSSSHGSSQSNAPRTPETTGNEDIDERLAALRERLSDGRNTDQREG